MKPTFKTLSPRTVETLLLLAHRIVPATQNLDLEEQEDVLRVVDEALAGREKLLRVQFLAFLQLLRWLSYLFYFRPLQKLAPEKLDRLLRRFEDSPIHRLRVGMWGIKTLLFMGYYGQHERQPLFGYTPDRYGNEKLHA